MRSKSVPKTQWDGHNDIINRRIIRCAAGVRSPPLPPPTFLYLSTVLGMRKGTLTSRHQRYETRYPRAPQIRFQNGVRRRTVNFTGVLLDLFHTCRQRDRRELRNHRADGRRGVYTQGKRVT